MFGRFGRARESAEPLARPQERQRASALPRRMQSAATLLCRPADNRPADNQPADNQRFPIASLASPAARSTRLHSEWIGMRTRYDDAICDRHHSMHPDSRGEILRSMYSVLDFRTIVAA